MCPHQPVRVATIWHCLSNINWKSYVENGFWQKNGACSYRMVLNFNTARYVEPFSNGERGRVIHSFMALLTSHSASRLVWTKWVWRSSIPKSTRNMTHERFLIVFSSSVFVRRVSLISRHVGGTWSAVAKFLSHFLRYYLVILGWITCSKLGCGTFLRRKGQKECLRSTILGLWGTVLLLSVLVSYVPEYFCRIPLTLLSHRFAWAWSHMPKCFCTWLIVMSISHEHVFFVFRAYVDNVEYNWRSDKYFDHGCLPLFSSRCPRLWRFMHNIFFNRFFVWFFRSAHQCPSTSACSCAAPWNVQYVEGEISLVRWVGRLDLLAHTVLAFCLCMYVVL